MSVQCEHCGEALQVLHYEQELGDPKTRLWTMVCPACREVHQYDSAWVRVRPGVGAATTFADKKAPFGLDTPAMAG